VDVEGVTAEEGIKVNILLSFSSLLIVCLIVDMILDRNILSTEVSARVRESIKQQTSTTDEGMKVEIGWNPDRKQ
jgi:hypothetical protein